MVSIINDENNEIVSRFGPDANNPDILSHLENLSKLFAITSEDLYIKWEQFSYQTLNNETSLSMRNLTQFKSFLQAQIEKQANAAVGNLSNSTTSNTSNSVPTAKKPKNIRPLTANSSLFGFNIPKTPILTKKRKIESIDGNDSKNIKLEFSQDENNSMNSEVSIKNEISTGTPIPKRSVTLKQESGKIIDSLNPQNLEISAGYHSEGKSSNDDQTVSKVRIQPIYDPIKYKFRTMRQNLIEVSDVLDEQIEIFTKLIMESFKLPPSDFADPTVQSQSSVYCVGRIVPDTITSEGFLNPESLSLETSRVSGIGRRVRLDLSNIEETSLFAGQIVGLRGKNANGDSFSVEEILELPYPEFPVSTEEELLEYKTLLDNKSEKILVTSGPYIPDNNFDLSHLEEFVERVNQEIKPHIIIMFGPFIDVTNPIIMAGNIPHFQNLKQQPRTLNELFTKLITPILKKINPSTQVILIPSTKDALSQHASYPQDSFDRRILQLPKNFKCFTNPSTFQLNETFFSCSNVDIFKDMKEVTKGGKTSMSNRFDRISTHLLQQRRFYPVFPGSIKSMTIPDPNTKDTKSYKHVSGADLEVSYLGLTEFIGNLASDILIIPSEMHAFARCVKNVIFINPGKFIRMKGGRGTYAQISINCPDLNNDDFTKIDGDESVYLHNIWKRSRIDIVNN
ncbi:hypothetical protein KAFR_0H01120 [Kazachstania africana CBS 2517]|uniref:DNA polymerase alpha subunit B n=1 Tax=Kazachstania africana (strain ATCC 22294 / BCRC 22015 / CBS 2517 / CECT 1963 / NBRC 1671 / NRRL Y-8276) TaxID=1071382 RepID=H2AYW6_KAZAF|nr:hypothetical protein KAFR_0H01120 [Kazachstania africana CBS 2517]CCF59522.1 hypothetical protein KAFR_0H01120 [Kazachstania africana CBS 2517]